MLKQIKKLVRYAIPVPVKKTLKYMYYSMLDVRDALLGKNNPDYPPHRLNFVGSADFVNVGNELMEHLKTVSALKPHESVLDIGSGIGRVAIPLTKYLSPEGRYEGFDIDRRGVQWCQQHITPKYPSFGFHYADLYNKFYNKSGKILAKDFKFPYPDATFDFAFATSVFTHMLHADVERYFAELHRVLKPGGRYFITFFLLNPEVRSRMEAGQTTANFLHRDEECKDSYFSHKSVKEAETAYEESWTRDALRRFGLDDKVEIHHGWWSGVKGMSYQDVITGNNR